MMKLGGNSEGWFNRTEKAHPSITSSFMTLKGEKLLKEERRDK